MHRMLMFIAPSKYFFSGARCEATHAVAKSPPTPPTAHRRLPPEFAGAAPTPEKFRPGPGYPTGGHPGLIGGKPNVTWRECFLRQANE